MAAILSRPLLSGPLKVMSEAERGTHAELTREGSTNYDMVVRQIEQLRG